MKNSGFKRYLGENNIGHYTNDLYTQFENESKIHSNLRNDQKTESISDSFFDMCTDQDVDKMLEVFGITEDELGELMYMDGGGNFTELSQSDVDSGIGTINIDHDYDTTYTKFISDCDEHEVELIIKSHEYKSPELEEFIADTFTHLLPKENIEE